MKQATIFDMDGVLVDSESIHNRCDASLLEQYGIQASPGDMAVYAGVPDRAMWETLKEKHHIPDTVEAIMEKQMGIKKMAFNTYPFQSIPGVERLIRTLKSRGMRLGLASSSPRALIEVVLHKTGLTPFFDVVVSGEDVTNGKPAPDIFLKAALELGVTPGDAMVFEDSSHGVRAAKSAGMECIGYKNPDSGEQDLSMADRVITSFEAYLLQWKKECFLRICASNRDREGEDNRIGTLNEKMLHKILKQFLDGREEFHEVKTGAFVADIHDGREITEIQTRGFEKLRKKLKLFLEECPVTVVYPIACTKWLFWVDKETGEVSKKRKSPRTGQPYQIFFELYKIKHLLKHPNLRLHILLLDMEEYRFLDGYSNDRKRGSTRHERIPLALAGELRIDHPGEYVKLIPDSLPESFHSKDYQRHSGLSLGQAQKALNVLHHMGAVDRTGKEGNMFIYQRR
ncbi:MAG: HAD family phosphatase, partial [Clostridia bacterium]